MALEGNALSSALRQARLDAGLSQTQTVARMREPKSRNWLSQIENGHTKKLAWDMVMELATIYNVPHGWFEVFRDATQLPPRTPIPFFSSGRVAASLLKEGGLQVNGTSRGTASPPAPAPRT